MFSLRCLVLRDECTEKYNDMSITVGRKLSIKSR
jgi:hypothetical protein